LLQTARLYFYIGAAGSFALYGLIIFFLFYSIKSADERVKFANKSRVSFEVSIVETSTVKEEVVAPPKVEKPKVVEKPKPIKKEGGTSLKAQSVDLDSLFEDISDTIEEKEFTQEVKQKSVVQSRVKGEEPQKKSTKAADIMKNLSQQSKRVVTFQSTDGIEDAYKQKVHEIISSKLQVTNRDQGLKTVVEVTLSRFGKLVSYRITSPSSDGDFDRRFQETMESLKFVEFPINDKDSTIEFIITVME
jgi:outer membrane biosynthesis protein TonB